jgi:hypothetical protein
LELTLSLCILWCCFFLPKVEVLACCTSAGVSTAKSFVGAADVGLDQSPTMSRLALAGDDLRRGAWTTEEDEKLRAYVAAHGTGHWRSVGRKAGAFLSWLLVCESGSFFFFLPRPSGIVQFSSC